MGDTRHGILQHWNDKGCPATFLSAEKTGVLTSGWATLGAPLLPIPPRCGFVSALTLHLGAGGLVLSQGDYGNCPSLSMCLLL